MRKRADAQHLWADEQEHVADASTRGRDHGEVTAKQRAVLSMQRKVGNAGVSRSVQRFFWGDTSDWQAMLGGGGAGAGGGKAMEGKTDGSKVLDAGGGPAMGGKTDGSKVLDAGPAQKTNPFAMQSKGQVTEVHVLGYDAGNEKQVVGKGTPGASSGLGAKGGPALSGGAGSGGEDLWAEKSAQPDSGEVADHSKETMEPEKDEDGGDW